MKEKLLEMIENNEFFSEDYRESLKEIIPEFEKCVGFKQNNPYHRYDVYKHTLVAMENCGGDNICRLACLFHDIGKPDCHMRDRFGVDHFYKHPVRSAEIAETVLKRLGFSEDVIKDVCDLIKIHDMDMRPALIMKYVSKHGFKTVERLIELRFADVKAQSETYKEWRLEKISDCSRAFYSITEDDINIFNVKLNINGNKIKQVSDLSGDKLTKLIKKIKECVYFKKIPNEEIAIISYIIGRKDGRLI